MSHFPKPMDVLHYIAGDFVNMSTITDGLSLIHKPLKVENSSWLKSEDISQRQKTVQSDFQVWHGDRGLWSKPHEQPLETNSQQGNGHISVLQLHETEFCQKSEWLEADSSPESPVNNADSWHLDFSLWHPEWRNPA